MLDSVYWEIERGYTPIMQIFADNVCKDTKRSLCIDLLNRR